MKGDWDDLSKRIGGALEVAATYGMIDGDHHKMWVIDQMVRHLTGCLTVELQSRFPDANGKPYSYQGLGESTEYQEFTGAVPGDEYAWDEGIAP